MSNRPGPSADNARFAVSLSRNLEKNLLAYAAAAAAGVFILTQPANAKVVYTASNIPLAQGFAGGALTQFDINNDGVSDFAFSNYSYFTHGLGAAYTAVLPSQPDNEIVGILLKGQRRVTAAALAAGVQVGSALNFQSSPQGLTMAGVFLGSTGAADSGGWLKVETSYLGLKFMVNGEVHYGWARVKFPSPGAYASGSIYGYAYEDVANAPIVTGQTSGGATAKTQTTESTAPRNRSAANRSLGMLAAGASRIASQSGN